MEKIGEKALVPDLGRDMDEDSLCHKAIGQIDGAVEKGNYKAAFRLFRNNIIKILCGEGILDICSPYYLSKGKVKEDKVISEFSCCILKKLL